MISSVYTPTIRNINLFFSDTFIIVDIEKARFKFYTTGIFQAPLCQVS